MFKLLFPIITLTLLQSSAFADELLPPPLPSTEKEQQASKAAETKPNKAPKAPKAPPSPQSKIDATTYQKVMTEYREYLSTVPAKVRDEIKDYRKEMVRINKEKTSLYKTLSTEAQNFLKKERSFKKRLPIRQRKKFSQTIVN